MVSFQQFTQRLNELRTRVDEACRGAKRDPATVKILPVTKTHPAEAAAYCLRAGLAAVGENRVQEAAAKKPLAPAEIRWELIGHLQSNKAKLAAELFARVQSVDSVKLINLLDKAAGERGLILPILLQINAGNDPAKFGAEPAEASALLETALAKAHLRVDGLMTIAPLADDPDIAVRTFENLRQIRDELAARFRTPLAELSMGMSGDYDAAIRAGSTIVRVGTLLFGEREAQTL